MTCLTRLTCLIKSFNLEGFTTIPPFDGKYNPDAYLDWEIALDQKFECHAFSVDRRVRAATSEFSGFASVWWKEHCSKHPNNIPTTWDALKQLMRHRFVPSYYARDLLNKLQRLNQGSKSVEDYYQELQIGMLRCGLIESEEASMARFRGGLNREISDIIEYKEYNSMTRLFHLAMLAEREVQGRSRAPTNLSAGRTSPWTPRAPSAPSTRTTTSANTTSRTGPAVSPTKATTSAPAKSSTTSVASTGRTRDIQCHSCKGFGHIKRECPNKRVLVIREDGEYDSASDLDEDEQDGAQLDHDEEHVTAEDADQYMSIIAHRVLSAQIVRDKTNQRHNLFHIKGVVKERSVRIIIDGGSCNNLASVDMVEKLALPTRPHSHPYYIQWFNDGGKVKVTRMVRVHFSLGSYHDFVDCDIVPMQACSMLLGRPWQYDKHCIHDGKPINTHSLIMEGKLFYTLCFRSKF